MAGTASRNRRSRNQHCHKWRTTTSSWLDPRYNLGIRQVGGFVKNFLAIMVAFIAFVAAVYLLFSAFQLLLK